MSKLKRIRLPGGKWITRKYSERESDPAALAKAKPEEIWTAAEGRKILVRDMDMQHIVAVIKILEGRSAATCQSVQAEGVEIFQVAGKLFPIYKTLQAELKRRLEGKPEPQPETRNRAICGLLTPRALMAYRATAERFTFLGFTRPLRRGATPGAYISVCLPGISSQGTAPALRGNREK